jgi:hypothetical protein
VDVKGGHQSFSKEEVAGPSFEQAEREGRLGVVLISHGTYACRKRRSTERTCRTTRSRSRLRTTV